MGAAVQVADHGYHALVAAVFRFERPTIAIGVLDGDAAHGDGLTVGQIATWMEFGTENIPARSFIRAYFDEHEDALRADLRVLLEGVLKGQRTKEQALELLGQRAVAQIQARISAGIEPELAESTIDRKGSSTPLIDTGVLRSSITYRVEET